MTKLTHRQRDALSWLNSRHVQFPEYRGFSSSTLGRANAAMCRDVLEKLGYVKVERGSAKPSKGGGYRFHYSITDAGRAVLR